MIGKVLSGELSCMLKSLVSLSVLSLGRASTLVSRLKIGTIGKMLSDELYRGKGLLFL